MGKLHTPGQHCCLHIAPLFHCHLSPGKRSPATAGMPLASYQHVPSQGCHSSPFPSHHLQAVPHNSLDPPQAQLLQLTPSWPKNMSMPVTTSWDYSHCSRVGGAQGGWVGQSQCGALRAPEVASVEMMECRAMHSSHYQHMKGENVVNTTSTGFTHCMKAITHGLIISFTLFFGDDEANIYRPPPLPFLKVAVANHLWVCLHNLTRRLAT